MNVSTVFPERYVDNERPQRHVSPIPKEEEGFDLERYRRKSTFSVFCIEYCIFYITYFYYIYLFLYYIFIILYYILYTFYIIYLEKKNSFLVKILLAKCVV